MINKFKTLNKKTRSILIIILSILLILVFLLTYAFLAPIIGIGSNTDVDISGVGKETLNFTKGEDINLVVTPENFGMGASNLSGSTTLTAAARGNQSNVPFTTSYNLFLNIGSNDYEYSDGSTPELLLTVIDPDGNPVTEITGLTYTTQNGVSGFDITTHNGIIEIKRDYSITSPNYDTIVSHEWVFTVTLIAHSFDQSPNQDKTFMAMVEATSNEATKYKDITVNTEYNNQLALVPDGPLYTTQYSDPTQSIYWNQKYQRLEISFDKPYQTYEIEFTDPVSEGPLDDYIVSLVGNGQVTNENGYRYVGKPVDNYIWFNEELWQVIGVFDTVLADGTTTERLTKIIKAASIGGLVWDSGFANDWNESTLKNLLNTSYLNSEDGTTLGYCYGSITTGTSNCNYISTGIKDAYNNLIEDVTWNLGGLESYGTPEAVYNAERGTTVYSGRPTSGTGKIGLMYLSDYGYSANPSTCARTTSIRSYDNQNCAGSSWMYQEGFEWTIVPYSSFASYVWILNGYGYVNYNHAYNGFAGRPVLYLKSNVDYLGGSGTQDDPMQIGVQ